MLHSLQKTVRLRLCESIVYGKGKFQVMKNILENRIVTDPSIMVGKPIIKGTRITVELLLRQLAQGIKVEELLENYPHLTEKDIYAAVEYAARLVEGERAYPLPRARYGKTKTPA